MCNILIWNCKGVGNLTTKAQIKKLTAQHSIQLIGVMELLVDNSKTEIIMRDLHMEHVWANKE
ncbi:unnamed protein product [Spirodela intermedia]|uniref:Uncharacterized protein n=2 Tax=Spirodela intermedia TaxID=51605 RepID=A0A7I8JF96_SPIIN|nr:unnamed protein product [Spirodela intermedia]CAA6668817.1 unnamed protein product [Spirodela intermedia]CAA7405724.1 unnamed protein product [Spirodela intermedia]